MGSGALDLRGVHASALIELVLELVARVRVGFLGPLLGRLRRATVVEKCLTLHHVVELEVPAHWRELSLMHLRSLL